MQKKVNNLLIDYLMSYYWAIYVLLLDYNSFTKDSCLFYWINRRFRV